MALPKFQLYLRGYTGGWDFDADYIDYICAQHAGQRLDVVISSPGGRLDTALRVSAAFARHGDVHVHYSAMNASAATIAGMGAKEITMDKLGAFWLVHKSSILLDVFRQVNSADMAGIIQSLQERIKQHETFDAQIAEMYAKRCKRTPEELADLMSEEKWLSSTQALEWGFIDRLIDNEEPEAVPESVVCAMREAGLPSIPKELRGSSLRARIEETVGGILESFGLKRIQPEPEESAEDIADTIESTEDPTDPTFDTHQNSNDMNPTVTPQATTQPSAGVETTPQASVETPTAESAQIAELRAQLAERDARIAELESTPGAETLDVVESSKPATTSRSSLEALADNFSEARALMDSCGF